jgi:hypothetical protein
MNVIRVLVVSTALTNVKQFDQNKKFYGTQQAAIFNGGDFPMPFGVNVEQDHEYPPGDYTLDPKSFQRDERGNLKLKSLKLLPLGGSSAPVRK